MPSLLVDTGALRHRHDDNCSRPQNCRRTDINLEVGRHARVQTRRVGAASKPCSMHHGLMRVVVGDVNSTLACSLGRQDGLPAPTWRQVRRYDRSMPRKQNRMTDQIADLSIRPSEWPTTTSRAKAFDRPARSLGRQRV